MKKKVVRKEPCTNKSAGIILTKPSPTGDLIALQMRKWPPYGWAPSAGHVDKGETELAAAVREMREEFRITLVPEQVELQLVWNRPDNVCSRANSRGHDWSVYTARVSADIELRCNSKEAQIAGWFDVLSLQLLANHTFLYKLGAVREQDWRRLPGLEPVWLKFLAHPKIGLIRLPPR